MDDTRNVIDEFKGKTEEEISAILDSRGLTLEIAIENLERDFNMGTIVRSANAFGVRTVHVIGRRQWNKRGAMMTDKYLHVVYHESVKTFVKHMKQEQRTVIGIDNTPRAQPLTHTSADQKAVMVFGSEKSGLSDEMLSACEQLFFIAQIGSTRSLNVGVAAGIAMHQWLFSELYQSDVK